MNLPEKEIIDDYLDGKHCYELGVKYGCSYKTIGNLLHRNGIKLRRSGNYSNSKKETKLSQHHCEIIDGLLLGDGCLSLPKTSITPHLRITTIEQEYANFLLTALPLEMSVYECKPRNFILRGKNCYGKKSYRIVSKVDLSLKNYWHKWYPNRKKIIPLDLILTPTSVKYWFWGDGTTSYSQYKNMKNYAVGLKFCTNGFSLEDCKLLINKLKEYTKINFTINFARNQPLICCGSIDGVNKFFDYIGTSDVACYKYKWKRPSANRNALRFYSLHETVENPRKQEIIRLYNDQSIHNEAKELRRNIFYHISVKTGIGYGTIIRVVNRKEINA